jgi:hypothetical protein
MDIGGPTPPCSRPYLGALPDRERVVAAMNFDNLVAVLAVAVAVPLVLAAVPRRSGWRSCSSSPAWRSTSATFAGLAPAWPGWRSA